jgi:hypothetical protein
MGENDPAALVEDRHDHLRATGERPVERDASRWIGEAEAVAGDLADADVDPDVRTERVGHVAELLSNVEGTGDDAAVDHVEAARERRALQPPDELPT